MVKNLSPVEMRTSDGPRLNNIAANKKRSKRRDFNDYSLVTKLVRKYKETNNENDLLEILKALEGIINSFTIMLTPGDATQQIYLNPFMKKFLYMFLTPAEKAATSIHVYMQAVYRIRWIMRYHTYEDIYNKVVEVLIQIVKSMKIVETDGKVCDCIFYIQLVAPYKMHTYILKAARDVTVDIKDMPSDFGSDGSDENFEDALDRLSYDNNQTFTSENQFIASLYDEVGPSVLTEERDVFKCLSYYEKYIVYLYDFIGLSANVGPNADVHKLKIKYILNVLKHETQEELEERVEDIKYKLELVSKEGDEEEEWKILTSLRMQ